MILTATNQNDQNKKQLIYEKKLICICNIINTCNEMFPRIELLKDQDGFKVPSEYIQRLLDATNELEYYSQQT